MNTIDKNTNINAAAGGNVRPVCDSGSTPRAQRSYDDTTWWDPYVENIADEATYLRRKFRQDVTDRTTGLSQEELRGRLEEIVAAGNAIGEDWRVTKAKCFAAQALEESIDVSPLDWFPAIAVWDQLALPITKVTKGDLARAEQDAYIRRAENIAWG